MTEDIFCDTCEHLSRWYDNCKAPNPIKGHRGWEQHDQNARVKNKNNDCPDYTPYNTKISFFGRVLRSLAGTD